MNFKSYSPKISQGVFIAESANVIGQVTINDDSSIWFSTVLRGDINNISIGKGTNIQDNTTVHVDRAHSTGIGDYVTIGHNAVIHGCTIKDRCLIGIGAIILNGAVIGEDCIVGANSLVTQDKVFPPGSLILGSPAKVIRPLTTEEKQQIISSANNYIKLSIEYTNKSL
jgi:carbonic anhydrase/acetyltransferase-like protein (isoleucine patch superfamily)